MPFKNTYTTFDDVECGLVSVHDGFVLPLYMEKCEVYVEVVNHIGHYTVKQTYANLTDETIEALYIYPIQEGGAVHFFSAESNGKVVESVVKEKGEETGGDFNEDDLAMEDTRTAFLISEFKPDIYQLALGELDANSITTLELRYVCELPIENNAVKLSIPNTVAPQYSPPADDCPEKTAADQLVDMDKDIDIEISVRVRQTIAFKVVSEPEEIAFVDGDANDEDGFFFSTGAVSPKRTLFEEEFLFSVSTVSGKSFGARILVEETTKGEVAAMVTIVPEFPAVDYQAEMVFLVDRSGSMSGRSIEKAKEALHIFLASLPSDCKFNICSFNANFDFLFEASVPYNDTTLGEAREYTDNMRAGGGTKVYEPLETIFKQKIEDGCKRQIFVLTDGHVSRPQESSKMVAKYAKDGRVFSLGIGEGASRELVNGLARSGNGSALFVTLAEDLKDKVLELLSSSLLPVLSNITLDWLSDMKPQKKLLSFFKSGNDDVGTPMTLGEQSAPHPVPHCFSTRLCIVYQSLEFGNLPKGLRISGTGPEGDVMLVVNMDTTKVMKSELLHKLMARRMVKMMEEDDGMEDLKGVQARMTNLGTNYNITNKWCASLTTAQFGAAAPKAPGGSATSATEAVFQAAPRGMVRRGSSSPPSSPLMAKSSKQKGGFGMKGKKKSGGGIFSSTKSGGGIKMSAPYSSEMRNQCSNTRMAKSKNMSFSPSVQMSAPQMMRSSAPPMQQMQQNTCSSPMQLQSQQTMHLEMQYESVDSSSAAAPTPYKHKSAVRDEMLMGFTVLQNTDGSYSYGPAFAKDLNMTEADIDAGAQEFGIDKPLFLTLIVVIYLRSVMANRKSSWSRMGEKGDGFIAANLGGNDLAIWEGSCEKFIDRFIKQSRSNVLFKGHYKK